MIGDEINTLIIGLGKIGCGYDYLDSFQLNKPESSKKIITHARAVSVHPSFNLVGAIDYNLKSCEKFYSIYKKPAFKNIDEFMQKITCRIDMVIFAVIPQNQPALIEEVIKKINTKILLIEKPLATSLEEVHRIRKICNLNPNLIICVNYIRRYLPIVNKWREIILSGKIGRFIYGNITYGKGLLTNGSHFINLAQYWLGEFENYKTLKKGLKYEEFDNETSFVLKLKNCNSMLNINSIGGHNLRAGEIDLWFEGGRICWLNNGNSLNFWSRESPKNNLETYDSLSKDPEVHFTEINKSQYYVLESIYKYFHENKKNILPCPLDSSIKTMELIFKAL